MTDEEAEFYMFWRHLETDYRVISGELSRVSMIILISLVNVVK